MPLTIVAGRHGSWPKCRGPASWTRTVSAAQLGLDLAGMPFEGKVHDRVGAPSPGPAPRCTLHRGWHRHGVVRGRRHRLSMHCANRERAIFSTAPRASLSERQVPCFGCPGSCCEPGGCFVSFARCAQHVVLQVLGHNYGEPGVRRIIREWQLCDFP